MISFKSFLPMSLSIIDESFGVRKHILGTPGKIFQGLYVYKDHSLYRILSCEWGDEADIVKRLIVQNQSRMDPEGFNKWFDSCFPEMIMRLSRKDLERIFQHKPYIIREIFRRSELRKWDMGKCVSR